MILRRDGFTLIEIIASLVLVGILAAIAGTGIVAGTKSYSFVQENSVLAQNSQLAMTRMKREMLELKDISGVTVSGADVSSITYTNSSGSRTLQLNSGRIQLGGFTLVDNVASFSLNLFKEDGSGNAVQWVYGSDGIQDLCAVRINLSLSHPDVSGATAAFTTVVSPRNNRNTGSATIPGGSGAVGPSLPPGMCFVATAAFGDDAHPVVLILREFRDSTLLRCGWGRGVVRFYYSYGPVGAEWIKGRPWACFASRMVLYPLAGCAFLAMHAPAALLSMWLLTFLAIHAFARHVRRSRNLWVLPLSGSRGSVLIGLIATIVVFAVLAAGMYSITSTSSLNQVAANSADKAYYLAESGFRYAVSRYVQEPADTKNQVLQSLNAAGEFLLSGSEEKFRIRVYPYFYAANRLHNANESTLVTYAPGEPTPAPPVPGKLNIAGTFYDYSAYNAGTGTFTLTTQLGQSVAQHATILPATTLPVNSQIQNGGNLTIANASFFPNKNGHFQVEGDGSTFYYDRKSGNTLINVRDADVPTRTFNLSFNANTRVTLLGFAKLHSLGTFAGGLAATREVVYHAPIGWVLASTPGPQTYHESFDDLNRWDTSTEGGYGISSNEGNNALDIAGTDTYGDLYKANTGGLRWDADYANLDSAWRYNDYYLSYDAQVKVKIMNQSAYFAGLLLRMDPADGTTANSTTLGLAFVQGEDDYGCLLTCWDDDDVPDRLIPNAAENQPLVVLWQKELGEDVSDLNWLAYKALNTTDHNIPQAVFQDNVETGNPYWTAGGTWSIVTNGSNHYWDDSPGGNYATNTNHSLTSQTMDLSHVTDAVLSFRQLYSIHPGVWVLWWNPAPDHGYVEISTNGGTSWIQLAEYTGDQGNQTVSFDISGYVPCSTLKVRFRLSSNGSGTRDGWYIDDVVIRDKHPHYDTLLVRLEERTTTGTETFPNQRVNDLKVYVGSTVGSPACLGSPNGSPLDKLRLANPRWPDNSSDTSVVHWPADEVADRAAGNDYFTLLEGWTINSSFSSSVAAITDNNLEPGATAAILRLNTYTSPTSGTFEKQEIGLHALGNSATSVYFDDFAIRLGGPRTTLGFRNPIQE